MALTLNIIFKSKRNVKIVYIFYFVDSSEDLVHLQYKLNKKRTYLHNEREFFFSNRIFKIMAISETDVIIELSPNDFQTIILVTK